MYKLALVFALAACVVSANAQVSLTGKVTAVGNPILNARVTLFVPSLTLFFEQRTDPQGNYRFDSVPAGTYRLGIASPGREYSEQAIQIGTINLNRDAALTPETNPGDHALGRWRNAPPNCIAGEPIGFQSNGDPSG